MTNLLEAERIPWHPAFTAVPVCFIAFALPASLYFKEYMRICIYVTANRLFMNCRCYQTILQGNIPTQIGSCVKCWVDIYHWSPGLAMTGRIHDIFLFLAQQPLSGPATSFTRFLDHTRHTTVGIKLLWTRDQPIAENLTWQHTTITTDRHPCTRWDSNPQSQRANDRRPTP